MPNSLYESSWLYYCMTFMSLAHSKDIIPPWLTEDAKSKNRTETTTSFLQSFYVT